ncbi:hypothetical protein PanWU01x14_087680, partial [Parasponia andersonii]
FSSRGNDAVFPDSKTPQERARSGWEQKTSEAVVVFA